jgi:Fur family zinc uptake transcriptional regulator
MASGKRLPGFLHQRVLRLLEAGYPHPLTGLQLVELLHAEGDGVPASQVYRALRRLIDEGAARKVLVAGGYVPVGPAPVALLWCRGCDTVEAVPCPELFGRLEAGAGAAGLAAMRFVVEVPGLCAVCARQNPG